MLWEYVFVGDVASEDLSKRVGFARERIDDSGGRMMRIDCRVKVEGHIDPRLVVDWYPYP
jgi:hypothetical protein